MLFLLNAPILTIVLKSKTNLFDYRNVIHGSDAVESARKEIALWFPEGIAEWQSSLHSWIYE